MGTQVRVRLVIGHHHLALYSAVRTGVLQGRQGARGTAGLQQAPHGVVVALSRQYAHGTAPAHLMSGWLLMQRSSMSVLLMRTPFRLVACSCLCSRLVRPRWYGAGWQRTRCSTCAAAPALRASMVSLVATKAFFQL